MASSGVEKRSLANLVTRLGSLEVIAPFETHTHRIRKCCCRLTSDVNVVVAVGTCPYVKNMHIIVSL